MLEFMFVYAILYDIKVINEPRRCNSYTLFPDDKPANHSN